MDQIRPTMIRLDPAKFRDPLVTANGENRAAVHLRSLDTLWFNTGTLCNVTCGNCYIESSPRNDRLAYLTRAEAALYLDEIARDRLPTRLIGFTGGEPFMNPDIIGMLHDVLDRGLDALVLTNAMQPLRRHRPALLALLARHGARLRIRVSLDHHTQAVHEAERGAGTWPVVIDGLLREGETLNLVSTPKVGNGHGRDCARTALESSIPALAAELSTKSRRFIFNSSALVK